MARGTLLAYPVVLIWLLAGTRDLALGGLLESPAFVAYSTAAVAYALHLLWAGRTHSLDRGPTLSIVVPLLDDEDRVEQTIEQCFAAGAGEPGVEVVAVNDCSSDETWQRLLRAKARHPGLHAVDLGHRYGKPAAMLEGTRRATGDIVCFVDAGARVDVAALQRAAGLLSATSVTSDSSGAERVYDRACFADGRFPVEAETAVRAWSPAPGPVPPGDRLLAQAFPPGAAVYIDGVEPAPEVARPSHRARRIRALRPAVAFAAVPLLILPLSAYATFAGKDGARRGTHPLLALRAAATEVPTGLNTDDASLSRPVAVLLVADAFETAPAYDHKTKVFQAKVPPAPGTAHDGASAPTIQSSTSGGEPNGQQATKMKPDTPSTDPMEPAEQPAAAAPLDPPADSAPVVEPSGSDPPAGSDPPSEDDPPGESDPPSGSPPDAGDNEPDPGAPGVPTPEPPRAETMEAAAARATTATATPMVTTRTRTMDQRVARPARTISSTLGRRRYAAAWQQAFAPGLLWGRRTT